MECISFFFSSRRRHTRLQGDWSSDVCSSDLPRLIPDLLESRCDVAMFAVGILAQRQKQLRFTQPYLSSDIYGVTTKSNQTVQSWADIDQPGVQVAVQRGTFMEPVMRETLRHARLVPIEPPQRSEEHTSEL